MKEMGWQYYARERIVARCGDIHAAWVDTLDLCQCDRSTLVASCPPRHQPRQSAPIEKRGRS
jgi:hypothetical protein